MFEILGYKHPDNFKFEQKDNQRGSVDAMLFEGKNTVAIEWKGANIKKLDGGKSGETPADQLFRYMSKTEAQIGIVGNFLEWRIYNYSSKHSKYKQFILEELITNDNTGNKKLVEMFVLLQKSTLPKLAGLILESQIEQENITNTFYKEYSQIRLDLFDHLCKNNPSFDKILLLEKTQKLLDRLIFVFFCEDTAGLLPKGISKDIFDIGRKSRDRSDQKIWREFRNLFLDIDTGRDDVFPKINAYNGGLFKQDDILENLIILDDVWVKIVGTDGLNKYDYSSDLSVNILGHIFEQSIGDLEQIKQGLENGQIVSKRKKDGIFYTPEYITDFIVEQTVGAYLTDNPDKINTLRVLDPACGSGAFPNQVFNFLMAKSKDKGGDLFDTIGTEKQILTKNIFGVDLQAESVEISKLSLWLKTAKADQKLQNLDNNFKVGNSLISDPKIAKKLAFDWNTEFEQKKNITNQQQNPVKPLFDVIVGNPPYVSSRGGNFTASEKEFYYTNFALTESKLNTYLLFIEQAYNLLTDGGYLGYIIPNTWLTVDSFKTLRKFLLENTANLKIVNILDKVFPDANVDVCILVFKKAKPTEITLCEMKDKIVSEVGVFDPNIFCKDSYIINIDAMKDTENSQIMQKLEENCQVLEEVSSLKTGIQAYETGKGNPIQTDEMRKNRIWHSKTKIDNNYIEYLQGSDVERYNLNWSGEFVKYGKNLSSPRNMELFQKPRILVRQIPSQPPYCINACFVDEYIVSDKNSMIIFDFKANPKFVLGCLNSAIVSRWFLYKFDKLQRGIFPQFKVKELAQFPIPKASQTEQEEVAVLVDLVMDLKKQKNVLVAEFVELVDSKYAPKEISKKMKEFYRLDFATFLSLLTKQKAVIGGLKEELRLKQFFDSETKVILQIDTQTQELTGQIEELVVKLYKI